MGPGGILDRGDLPFSNEIKESHKTKIGERRDVESRRQQFETIVESILGIGKGALVY